MTPRAGGKTPGKAAKFAAPADQDQRDAAVFERARNVVMEAGAGTGKTTTLVRRLVQMVAPDAGARKATGAEPTAGPALSMRRIAAITFTRRAAGELSLRIREELLKGLSDPDADEARRTQLRLALSDLDTAYVGTIHSFADRLLRMKPAESRLSPNYEVVEDETELIEETYQLLLRGAEQGTLASTLTGTDAVERAAEAEATVRDSLLAGVLAQTRDTGWSERFGLDALVAQLIRQRDVPPVQDPVTVPDLEATRGYMQEFIDLVAPLSGDSSFGRWTKAMAARMQGWMAETDPVALFAELSAQLHERRLRENRPQKKRDCGNDNEVWRLWKALHEGGKHRDADDVPLADDLTAEVGGWLARRLVRLSPVVVALYEQVKARLGVIDQIDLLLKLRDLLRDNLEARGFYQGLFDHVLVDEFQDTDPLQAEVVQFLCEQKPVAPRAEEVVLAAGKLTLVGDPKQSIYRFRRADVAMYDRVTRKLGNEALRVELEANFRTVPSLVDWYNARFPDLLGESEDGATFEAQTGKVFHRDLGKGRQDDRVPAVHVLPFELAVPRRDAPAYRALESETLSHYLRWLVEQSGEQILEKGAEAQRPVRYEDVCVLAITTTNLPLLFDELDFMDVPYAASGGLLFLTDPLHRQFMLGLRALADPDDGVAEAALLRPPFFATDLRDLFESQAEKPTGPGPGRVAAARELIGELRDRRLHQSPGTTARDLLERTGLGRSVALGPNGGQRLQRLRELCHVLEVEAAENGLDYDGATAELRTWVTEPVKLEAPRPVAEDAIQVMTVHQAKGLEFPVVVLWDGRAEMKSRVSSGGAWRVAQEGKSWSLALEGLKVSVPRAVDLTAQEKLYRDEERGRLVYVAATRARDLLVVPQAGSLDEKLICGRLLSGEATKGVEFLELFEEGEGAPWAKDIAPHLPPECVGVEELEEQVQGVWEAAAGEAGASRFVPIGVSRLAHAETEGATDAEEDVPRTEEEEEDEGRWKDRDRRARYGPEFGTVVHRALDACVRRGVGAREAVEEGAGAVGLKEHLGEAVGDVERGLEALERERLMGEVGPELRLEYPVSGPGEDGTVLLGYVDLVRVVGDQVTVVDFKTDRPPEGAVEEELPGYVRQVRMYGELLGQGGVGGEMRCGLLFTGDGGVRWV